MSATETLSAREQAIEVASRAIDERLIQEWLPDVPVDVRKMIASTVWGVFEDLHLQDNNQAMSWWSSGWYAAVHIMRRLSAWDRQPLMQHLYRSDEDGLHAVCGDKEARTPAVRTRHESNLIPVCPVCYRWRLKMVRHEEQERTAREIATVNEQMSLPDWTILTKADVYAERIYGEQAGGSWRKVFGYGVQWALRFIREGKETAL